MTEPSPLWPVVTVTLGLLAWLVSVRFRRGPVLAPFSLSLLMLVAIFGIRPLLMLYYGDYDFYGYPIADGFNAAARAGFVGVAALCLGYWASRSMETHREERRRTRAATVAPRPRREPPTIEGAMLVCVGAVVAWFAVMIYLGGGIEFLPVLFRGRSPYVQSVLGQIPSAVFCLPLAGAAIAALARTHVARTRPLSVRESVMFWASVAVTTVPATSLGVRRFILPALLMALVAVVHSRWTKPITLTMGAFTAAGFLLLAAIPFVRSAGSRTSDTDFTGALVDYFGETGLMGTIRSFFISYDTEGFAYVSYAAPRLGNGLPYGNGRGTVGDALLNPLPASFGVPTWADQLLSTIFGTGCDTSSQCPIASVVGILLFDLGAAGVFLGCVLLGWFFARFDRAILHAHSYGLLALLVVAGFTPAVIRGSSVNSAWLAENVLLIAAVLLRVFGRRTTVPPAGPPLRPAGAGRSTSAAPQGAR